MKFQRDFPELEAAIDQARGSLAKQSAPWNEKIKALEEQRDAALVPFEQGVKDAEKSFNDARSAAFTQAREQLFERCEKHIPTIEDLSDYAMYAHDYIDKQYPMFHPWQDEKTEIRAPKVPGMILKAVAESDRAGACKFYAAWHEGTNKLASMLAVEPAKHPADAAQAFGLIDGKPIVFEVENYSTKHPVQTWVAQLRTISKV